MIWAIPDIHGRFDLLWALWNKLLAEESLDLEKDKVIFLGDMIDRGPDSKRVVEFVRDLSTHNENVIALIGNHEIFAIESARGPLMSRRDTFLCWTLPNNGGASTLYSYGGEIPADVLDWFESLPTYHEEPGFFFSHAPAPRENRRSILRQGQPLNREELTWTYAADEFGVARVHGPDIVGVCGHIHKLRDGVIEPRFYPHYIFADAGCGCSPRAPLVAIDVASRRVIYAAPTVEGEHE